MGSTLHLILLRNFPTRLVPAAALHASSPYPSRYDPNSLNHKTCVLLRPRMIATKHCTHVLTSRLSKRSSHRSNKGKKNVSSNKSRCCDPPWGSSFRCLKVSDTSGIMRNGSPHFGVGWFLTQHPKR